MSLLSNVRRWIGPSQPGAEVAAAGGAPASIPFADSLDDSAIRNVRPQVLRVILGVVLRDVQLRAALSTDWLELEVLDCEGPLPGTRGLHARLVLKVWAPRVLASAAQLERLFIDRLCEMDPDALRWFRGLSWRLELPAGQALDALPGPYEWSSAAQSAPGEDTLGFAAVGSARVPSGMRH
ncbi:MAG TPA: hypothetical protein VHA82_09295 [Ramlibacter sp.]|uniref:hypothetical protein n=1 Tax=Ramlibacter sp. TaxID=1917967 RepID=UPI002C904CAC|nr:hypothetical protein [Ramlibacter sp.]HVZ43993.1 hypothetical protein [Ramlibacter sp.]